LHVPRSIPMSAENRSKKVLDAIPHPPLLKNHDHGE
jgi:hypothetical protein